MYVHTNAHHVFVSVQLLIAIILYSIPILGTLSSFIDNNIHISYTYVLYNLNTNTHYEFFYLHYLQFNKHKSYFSFLYNATESHS